jgi:periplasmic divalent cation tolerance protein
MTDCVQVSTATETREQAIALARDVVQARLASGVQVTGPAISVFWHLGELGQSEEWRLLFRTTRARYPDLEAFLLENHPWNNPEIVAISISTGSEGYLKWISANTIAADGSDDGS